MRTPWAWKGLHAVLSALDDSNQQEILAIHWICNFSYQDFSAIILILRLRSFKVESCEDAQNKVWFAFNCLWTHSNYKGSELKIFVTKNMRSSRSTSNLCIFSVLRISIFYSRAFRLLNTSQTSFSVALVKCSEMTG